MTPMMMMMMTMMRRTTTMCRTRGAARCRGGSRSRARTRRRKASVGSIGGGRARVLWVVRGGRGPGMTLACKGGPLGKAGGWVRGASSESAGLW
jgi:hypothetical protein